MDLHASKLLIIIVTLIHVGAFICIFFANLPIWLIFFLIGAIGLSFYITLRRYSKNIIKIWHKEADTWCLLTKTGKVIAVKLNNNSFMSRYLIILNFKGSYLPVILCPDTANINKIKCLRVHLKSVHTM